MYKLLKNNWKKTLYALGSCSLILLQAAEGKLCAQDGLCAKITANGSLNLKPPQWEQAEVLCACDNLKQLSLKKSPLLRLPDCFEQMQDLRRLDLSKSTIAAFPMQIIQLPALEYLSLAHTRLAHLPDEVADMPALRHLDLRGTAIEDLPDGLHHLEVIDMRLIMLSKREQDELRARYPQTQIFLSSPCHCH